MTGQELRERVRAALAEMPPDIQQEAIADFWQYLLTLPGAGDKPGAEGGARVVTAALVRRGLCRGAEGEQQ